MNCVRKKTQNFGVKNVSYVFVAHVKRFTQKPKHQFKGGVKGCEGREWKTEIDTVAEGPVEGRKRGILP